MSTPVVLGCDSVDVDTTTQQCAHPYWTAQTSFLPPLDIPSGITVGVAILACWAVAYGLRRLRQA